MYKLFCFYFLGVYNMYLSEYKQYSPIKNSTPAFLFTTPLLYYSSNIMTFVGYTLLLSIAT